MEVSPRGIMEKELLGGVYDDKRGNGDEKGSNN
jgi:hypothetical protein